MKTHLISGLLAIGLVAFPGWDRARAEEITFGFTGQVTLVTDANDFIESQVQVGSELTGQYTFESTTLDTRPDDPTFGRYIGAVNSISAIVGAVEVSGPLAGQNQINTGDNFSNLPFDSYQVGAPILVDNQEFSFFISLIDDDASAFTSDVLPLMPPQLSPFNIRFFEVLSEPLGVHIRGEITSLAFIPEPQTVILLALFTITGHRMILSSPAKLKGATS